MKDRHVTLAILVLTSSSVSLAIYLISDYYMDDGWPASFGQACGDTVGDDCAYINSHLNTFGLIKYDSDISCTMMLDAGKQRGARYKFSWKRFDFEDSPNCTSDSLTLYDAHLKNTTIAAPFGIFCGGNNPNTTGFPSQRFVTIKFKTDGGTNKKGFRVLATRTVPYPCPSDDFFHCKSENRCIDSRLHCDGTIQCDDETDEDGCSVWEKMIGGFLALGVAGIIGICGMCMSVCITVGVIICVCTCCKKCCRACCGNIRDSVKDKMGSARDRLGSLRNTRVSAANDNVEMVDLEASAATSGAAATVIVGGKKNGDVGKSAEKNGDVGKSGKGAGSREDNAEIVTARDVVIKNVVDEKQCKKDREPKGNEKADTKEDQESVAKAVENRSPGDKGKTPKAADREQVMINDANDKATSKVDVERADVNKTKDSPEVPPRKDPDNNQSDQTRTTTAVRGNTTTAALSNGDGSANAKEGITKVDTK